MNVPSPVSTARTEDYDIPGASDVVAPMSPTVRLLRRIVAVAAVGVALVLAVVGYRQRERLAAFFEAPQPTKSTEPDEVVQVAGPSLVRVAPDSALEKKLVVTTAHLRRVNTPILNV